MITLGQIRAARALLNWTQDDLAAAAGISRPSINNLERGLYSARPETFQSIVSALEKAGVEFTPNSGLRLRQEEYDISTLSGPDFVKDLDHDVLSVLRGPNDEIVGCAFDEMKWMEYGSVTNPIYDAARKKRKFKERYIVPNNIKHITSPTKIYRTLPPKNLGSINYEVYGNRLAIIEWKAMRVTLIKSIFISEMFLKQFEVLWALAKPLTKASLQKIKFLK